MDCTHLHFLEGRASPAVRNLISQHARRVWEIARNPENCLEMSIHWLRVFEGARVYSVMLGRSGGSDAGGYRLSDGIITDHHFLAVGAERALFDPTAGQFRADGLPALDRYLVHDGRSFAEWRISEEAGGPPTFVEPAPPRRLPGQRA